MQNEDVKNNYKNRLRVVLAEKGISNHWLAQQLGVTDMSVSRWCTNKNQPSMAQFIKMSKILNIDINALLEILNGRNDEKKTTIYRFIRRNRWHQKGF